ncbi:MAG TPA: LLM class flavin-dependent oxidoreductase [Chloroflexota bacterium]
MKFSIRLNNDLPVDAYPQLARAAEEVGFDQFWVSDDLFLRSAWVILSAVAQQTERIQIGTCIVNPYTIHPAEMAMAAATLDELSHGRFVLGISSGADDFLGWVGIEAERPVSTVKQTIATLRRLFQGEVGSGPGWTDQAYLRFTARPIPIYVGAMSPRMLRLIGDVADGGLPLLLPPEQFAEVLSHIGPAENLDVAACIWCSVTRDDRAAAEQVLRDKIAYYGHALSPTILRRLGLTKEDFAPIQERMQAGDAAGAAELVTQDMLRIGVVGTAHELLPRLQHLVNLGARHLSFGPPLGPDLFQAIKVLGSEVLPRFRP